MAPKELTAVEQDQFMTASHQKDLAHGVGQGFATNVSVSQASKTSVGHWEWEKSKWQCTNHGTTERSSGCGKIWGCEVLCRGSARSSLTCRVQQIGSCGLDQTAERSSVLLMKVHGYLYGGFHKWGYPNSWLVYNGKSL